MKIFFWQNIISPHQYPYQRHLKKLKPEWDFYLIVDNEISDFRQKQGWEFNKNQTNKISILIKPNEEKIIEILSKREESIHIFSGFRISKAIRFALKTAIHYKQKIWFITEAVDNRGIKGVIRRILAKTIWERKYIKNVDKVLCMSSLAVKWYKWIGFKNEQLINFCYVVEKPEYIKEQLIKNKEYSFLYVGQLIKRKGVFLLLKSFNQLLKQNKRIKLTIIGDGKLKAKLLKIIQLTKAESFVEFKGILPNKEVYSEIANSNCLILPSRFDGWGAVINEALMCGIPVICSENCGAADLINNSKFGIVFNKKNKNDLTEAMKTIIKMNFDTKKIIKWSDNISGEKVAQYLILNIENYLEKNSKKLPAPWLS